MFRRGIEITFSIFIVLFGGATCLAQDSVEYSRESQTDAYLAERGLDRVLAARLRERLTTAKGDERTRVAEALGRVYAGQLERSKEPTVRIEVEKRCRELIESVPDVETFGLRIELARTMYLTVESDAEGARMKLNSPERHAETLRVLKVVVPQFEQLTKRLQSECERLQRRMDAADEPSEDALRDRLEEYRGFRSRAAYYAGWSAYYLALLEGDSRRAMEALEAFGVILGAVPGNQANLERINKGFIRFPHYARSMIGCALSASLLGRDVEALRWLDAVSLAPDLPQDVQSQLFVRYAIVLADAGRWSDLSVRTKVHRERAESDSGRLTKAEARLVAVLALSESDNQDSLPRTKQLTQELAQTALNDLVAAGEMAHVRDLFKHFGAAPIAAKGFISLYIRGFDAFDQARQLHGDSKLPNHQPVADASLIAAYQSTAELLKSAIESEDSIAYHVERCRARVKRGLALYFAGDLVDAANELEGVLGETPVEEDRSEALWFAIVSLDRAIRNGELMLRERCDRLATEHVRRYPGTERSVSLLTRLVNSGLLDSDDVIQSLLEVAPDSPMYLTARSEAVSRLYAKFSQSPREQRDLLALQIAEVGEDVLKRYFELAIASESAESRNAAERLVVRARQIADALLSMTSPDAVRASSVLSLIASTAERVSLNIDPIEPEMCYHRFRLAHAREDGPESQRAYGRLLALSVSDPGAARFLDAADSFTLSKAWDRYKTSHESQDAAKELIKIVGIMIERSDGDMSERLQGVYAKGAEAAFRIWSETDDERIKGIGMAWDEKLIAVVRNSSSLRRLARMYEKSGRLEQSLACWDEILGGTEERSEPWFEARIGSISVLRKLRPQEAADALRQFRVLYPGPAPEPWHTQLNDLQLLCESGPDPRGGGR